MLSNIRSEIGSTIRKRRELLGLLQPSLASIAGVSTRTLQLVELGKANPSLDTLLQILEPLGLIVKITLKELSPKEG